MSPVTCTCIAGAPVMADMRPMVLSIVVSSLLLASCGMKTAVCERSAYFVNG